MNKYLILLFFLLFFGATKGQDSLSPQNPTTAVAKFEEKDIKVDNDTIELKSFDKNFKKKYSDSAFVYEYQARKKNAWDKFKEWLIQSMIDFFRLGDTENSILTLKILAVLIVVVVIYFITKSLINKEGKWIFGNNSNKKRIEYTDIEKNIHLVDFQKLIDESISQNQKRLCIRYYYLWLLKVMAENHYIDWHVEKTNSDYLYELHNLNFKNEFSYLSYLYNYIWYGEFEVDEATFQKAQEQFKKSIKTFGNE